MPIVTSTYDAKTFSSVEAASSAIPVKAGVSFRVARLAPWPDVYVIEARTIEPCEFSSDAVPFGWVGKDNLDLTSWIELAHKGPGPWLDREIAARSERAA